MLIAGWYDSLAARRAAGGVPGARPGRQRVWHRIGHRPDRSSPCTVPGGSAAAQRDSEAAGAGERPDIARDQRRAIESHGDQPGPVASDLLFRHLR
jgi:hypothetical protein